MGFFMVHAAAVGALNKKLASGHGRANALYVLFYYIGGGLGITAAGFAYKQGGEYYDFTFNGVVSYSCFNRAT